MMDISTKSEPASMNYGSTESDVTTILCKEESSSSDSVTATLLSTSHHNTDEQQQQKQQKQQQQQQQQPFLRKIALSLSLWINVFITITKLVAYIHTRSLSVLAALVDSVLDIVSQLVLNYTEKHSSLSRSSAFYPAGASRLEPVGVLTCAALMGMASFEVIKESIERLVMADLEFGDLSLASFWSLIGVIVLKLGLLALCQRAAESKCITNPTASGGRQSVQSTDPTLEALAQDHWNDCLSNGVAAMALLLALRDPNLWWVDPVGAIIISLYIIHSWYSTGKEQVEQLTGKAAPNDFLEELEEIANSFDDRMIVDVCRAYHFGPKFLVEIEVVLPKDTLLFESHDLGMELQYEIEAKEEVERCFVHMDYQSREYDEHVVSKVPELREKYRTNQKTLSSRHSV
jgi:cation diffusion facilitator family transporter